MINDGCNICIIDSNEFQEVSLSLSVVGGKGGFGSMLRAAGKLNKTTNKSAMRDLSGRRHRFVEQEKELTQWLKEQKSNKNKMSHQEIQNDFRHIKKYGVLPEKRMCDRGIHCRYRKNCKFRHPDDDQNKSSNKKNIKPHKKPLNQKLIFGDNSQTDDDMMNALLMGGINAKKMNQKFKTKRQQKKKMIPLFGNDIIDDNDDNDNDDNHSDNNNDTISLNKYKDIEIMDDKHIHKLKYMMRNDCDFIICDFCFKQYHGASWHCFKGCDFDLCDDCVIIDNLKDISKDKHLNEWEKQQSNLMKEIEQKDQITMNIKSLTRNIDRKRKRNEKKLDLLGLERENITKTNIINDDDTSPIKRRKLNPINDKKGEIDLNHIKDVDDLKKFGMDTLKKELQLYGLKCGGTLDQRAERLFLLTTTKLNDLPRKCFVSKAKKSRKKCINNNE